MIIPPFLKVKDKIRIVAPAGKIKKEFVLPGVSWLKTQGFRVVIGANVFLEENQFAGSDKNRISDFQEALDDKETSVIICARGGYGSARIINKLDFSGFLKNPKWLIGFSDITVFHNHLANLGISSIHGAMLRHFIDTNGDETEDLKSLFNLLNGEKPLYSVSPNYLNRTGVSQGKLTGGNLAIIISMRGTKYDINTDGKVLFLEDVGEYLYNIDRMMQNLKLGGKLENLAGLVVGDFSEMKDSETPFGKNAYEIIYDVIKEYNYPVCFGLPAGHDRNNHALAFGQEWELTVNKNNPQIKLL